MLTFLLRSQYIGVLSDPRNVLGSILANSQFYVIFLLCYVPIDQCFDQTAFFDSYEVCRDYFQVCKNSIQNVSGVQKDPNILGT